MGSLTQNAKILLTVGIVLILLCVIGIVVQAAAYQEYAGDKPFSVHTTGAANGARGGFMQSLVAWNQSDQAKAKQAMDMIVLMSIGCAVGALLIYLALRPNKKAAVEPEEVPAPPSARRRASTRTTWK